MYNFWPKELERYNYFIIYTLKKNKKINSHSTLRPIKNMKLRHFIWGFNEVSFEISTEYVRMYNFWPKELERYNYFIIYTMKKNKKKIVIQLCGQSRTWNCDISFGVSTRFRLKFQPSMNVKLSAERTWTIQLFHYLLHETNKYKKSFKFAALRVNENATFLLGFQRGFGWNFNRVRTNV
jgi:hypothetical protein